MAEKDARRAPRPRAAARGHAPQRSPRSRSGTALLAALALALVAGEARAAAMLTQGATFPTWSLRDQTGATVSSRDLAGKTYLLWFYPKAMTPGCTAEGNALRDQAPAFGAAGVEVLGISFDPPERNAEFAKAQGFPFRLLSDDGTLAMQVGAADSSEQSAARRISYLVGPDGKVLKAYADVSPATHARDVLADATAGAPATPGH